MIDIENKVIDTIENAITSAGINADVTSEYVDSPSEFPHVYAREIGNSTYTRTQDTSLLEHHASIRFRIEVFSNKVSGAKEEVKSILNVCDISMQNMKFTRTSSNFIPNYDRSIVRAYADYAAIVREGVDEDGTTVHYMYRR